MSNSIETCNNCQQIITGNTKCQCLTTSLPNKSQPSSQYSTLTKRQKVLTWIGWGLTTIFAVACGVSAAGFLIVNPWFSVGLLIYIAAGGLAIGQTASNIYMCYRAIPEVLIDIFGRERFLQGLLEDEKGKELSPRQRAIMAYGSVLVFAAGVTFSGLSYSGFLALAGALGAVSAAIPPVAVILAVVTFAVLTMLLLKSVKKIVQDKNLMQSCKDFLKDLVNTDPELPRNKGKSRPRIIVERVITVALTALTVPLACIGLVMVVHSATHSMGIILLKIPHAMPMVVDATSKVVTLGMALLAELPFTIRTAFLSPKNLVIKVSNIISQVQHTDNESAQKLSRKQKAFNIVKTIFKVVSITISMVGSAVMSAAGAPAHNKAADILAAVGGAVNTFAGSTGDSGEDNDASLTKKTAKKNAKKQLFNNDMKPDSDSSNDGSPSLQGDDKVIPPGKFQKINHESSAKEQVFGSPKPNSHDNKSSQLPIGCISSWKNVQKKGSLNNSLILVKVGMFTLKKKIVINSRRVSNSLVVKDTNKIDRSRRVAASCA